MKQGLLAFQYEEEKSTTGMTALSGLMTYVELMHVAGLRSSVERRVGLRGGGQGWTDSQIITSLILLNLAGGESVMDLEVLEKDAGLCRVLRHAETHGMRRRERRALKARWRGERWRRVPSDSVVFRYLERFHDAGEEAKREAHRAFIPSPNDALKGLGKVNAGLVDFVQSRSPHTQATLDMDACLVESHKKEALYSYKKYRAYQPLTTYWAEADLVVHSEFRDGNVPALHSCPASTIFASLASIVLPVHLLGLAPLLGCIGAVAGDVKFQDDRVMDHPVDGRGGGHGVGKDVLPLREDQV